MAHYNIAFCGLGSIGKRHIRNVVTVLSKRGDSCRIDLFRSSRNAEIPDELRPVIFKSYRYEDIWKTRDVYDVVFITNPTSVHYDTINKFEGKTRSFFIEKPVFSSIDIDESFFDRFRNVVSYVACPLRYCAALSYIKKNVNYKNAFLVRAISSSYLPDWRPGQDYRNCYSAHRNMGGGVGIDLIHEWDYMTWLWGLPTKCYSIQDKISGLEIDSDDIAIYIGRNKQTVFELHLDYFGRSSFRTLEIFLSDETIRCDIENGKIEFLKAGKIVQLPSERDDYQIREIEHYFDILNNKIINDSTMEHAYKVLKIAKGL